MVNSVTLFAVTALFVGSTQAHIGVWTKGMFCQDGPKTTLDIDSNTVVNPLYDLEFKDFFFGNGKTNGVSNQCYNHPPPEGEFLEIPANGSFDVEFANNRAFSSMDPSGGRVGMFPDGEDHPEYDAAGYHNPSCIPQPLLHAEGKNDVAGSAFGIAYVSEYSQLTQDNIAIFTTNKNTPWHTKASFDVPNLPACPEGGCLCTWGWVPNGCGQPNSYLQLFRCKVTNARPDAKAVATPKAPVWCEGDSDKCVKGAKQMIYWHQQEKNNFEVPAGTGRAGEQADGKQFSPGYNTKLGWADGAQHDIFVDSPAGLAAPVAHHSSSTKKATSTKVSSKKHTSTKVPTKATHKPIVEPVVTPPKKTNHTGKDKDHKHKDKHHKHHHKGKKHGKHPKKAHHNRFAPNDFSASV